MIAIVVSVFAFECWLCSISAGVHQLMQTSIPRNDFVLHSEADQSSVHELVFSVAQKNLQVLDSMLLERSTPGSELYQQWLSFEEVGTITSNEEGALAVTNWLAENDVEVVWKSTHADYIKAAAPIRKWEELLHTNFFVYEDFSSLSVGDGTATKFHRANQYSLPIEIFPHLSAVFNTVQVPPAIPAKHWLGRSDRLRKNVPNDSQATHNLRGQHAAHTQEIIHYTTVDFLNTLYNITSNEGNSSQQQASVHTNDERFSPNDLTLFQQTYNLQVQPALDPFNRTSDDCFSDTCYEGNLDLQYMMGVAQNTSTVFWHVDPGADPYVTWITDVADMADPPLVNCISWTSFEQSHSQDTLDAFNTEALKLSIMGVTIVAASDENGAAGGEDRCSAPSGYGDANDFWTGPAWSGVGYFPSFPATSPYVTAVGATMGPESGDPEIACQSQLGGVITSGGGFSTYYPTPSWLAGAVSQYFATLPDNEQPTSGYNPNGRAYPDVALTGVWYDVFIQGEVFVLFGTSASAAVFAAMISLLNAQRSREGRPSVGFLNPTLYANTTLPLFNDITSGHNKCTVYGDIDNPGDAPCCESGFHAAAGWDPVTGLGSINFDKLMMPFAAKVQQIDDNINGTIGSGNNDTDNTNGGDNNYNDNNTNDGDNSITDDNLTNGNETIHSSGKSATLSSRAVVGIGVGGVLLCAAVVFYVDSVFSSAASIVPINSSTAEAGAGAAAAVDVFDMPAQAAVQVKPGTNTANASAV